MSTLPTRSDDVPDFYGTEPWPGEGDPDPHDYRTLHDRCEHAEACDWLAWWIYEREGAADADADAEYVLSDGGACAECPFAPVTGEEDE
jgi:hypothetical protein